MAPSWMLSLTLICIFSASSTANRYFWHITDVQADPYYGSQEHWQWNSCSQDADAEALGSLADYECDSSWQLVESSIKAMSNIGPGPEFILWTGDSPSNPKDRSWLDRDSMLEIVQNVTNLLTYYFHDVPVVVCLGNHDYWPHDQLPGDGSDIYEALYDMWGHWLDGPGVEETFKKGAYYTKMLSESAKVRVVVTNTNLYSTNNSVTSGQDDPGEQFQWLEDVLSQARTDGEQVHLVTHIPPGVMERSSTLRWFTPSFNTKFTDIVSKYGDVILASYSAHQHLDTFRLFYYEGEPVVPMLIAPSVTPSRGVPEFNAHNPAVRKIFFHDDTYEVSDVQQWSLDLNKHGDDTIEEAKWEELYSYRSTYDIEFVNAEELHFLAEDFKEYASEKFHLYYELNTVKTTHPSNEPCDNDCKVAHICAIQEVYFEDYDRCLEELDISGTAQLSPAGILLIALLGSLLGIMHIL